MTRREDMLSRLSQKWLTDFPLFIVFAGRLIALSCSLQGQSVSRRAVICYRHSAQYAQVCCGFGVKK